MGKSSWRFFNVNVIWEKRHELLPISNMLRVVFFTTVIYCVRKFIQFAAVNLRGAIYDIFFMMFL